MTPIPPVHDDDPLVSALSRSARSLAEDPAATPAPGFRQRARATLLLSMRGSKQRRLRPAIHRLAGLGLAAALSTGLAMPALANADVSANVSSAVSAVGHFIGLTGDTDSDLAASARLRHATHTPSQVAVVDSEDDEEEAEATATATMTATPTITPTATPEGDDDEDEATPSTHGPKANRTPVVALDPGLEMPDNHGQAVSTVAHSTPAAGETHGEQVRAVARDNHGQAVRATVQARNEERQQLRSEQEATDEQAEVEDQDESLATSTPTPGQLHRANNPGASKAQGGEDAVTERGQRPADVQTSRGSERGQGGVKGTTGSGKGGGRDR